MQSTLGGPLVVIGGAEDRHEERRILKRFVELSGGAESHIVVIAAASETPNEISAVYKNAFQSLGARDVTALRVSNRNQANAPSAIAAIEKATGVFFTGGNQLRITRLIGGTKLDTVLHNKHDNGMALAGTSAGAAMMSSIMIMGGSTESPYRVGMVELTPGMDFISGVMIDQHFEQRGRLRRLLSAIVQYPHDIGIGIDENTAVVISDSIAEVIGDGSVTVIDAGDLTFTNLDKLNKNDRLTLCGVKIHILSEGYRFDLRNRIPVIERQTNENR